MNGWSLRVVVATQNGQGGDLILAITQEGRIIRVLLGGDVHANEALEPKGGAFHAVPNAYPPLPPMVAGCDAMKGQAVAVVGLPAPLSAVAESEIKAGQPLELASADPALLTVRVMQ